MCEVGDFQETAAEALQPTTVVHCESIKSVAVDCKHPLPSDESGEGTPAVRLVA